MKRILFFTLAVAIGGVCAAAKPSKTAETEKLTDAEKAERRAAAQLKALKNHGGILDVKGKGALAVVNCQSAVPEAMFKGKVDDLRRITHLNVNLVNGKFDLADVHIPAPNLIAVFIVNDPKLPMSLISLEAKWGMMNVAPFLADSPSEAMLKSRVVKQLIRISAVTFGGGVSQYKGSPLQPVFSVKDLDETPGESFTIDSKFTFSKNLGALGITQDKKVTYRRACMEGWAAAPTNEFQKAVWDEVHQLPTEPIKIEPEKKKIEK